jgi:hypothetical protein
MPRNDATCASSLRSNRVPSCGLKQIRLICTASQTGVPGDDGWATGSRWVPSGRALGAAPPVLLAVPCLGCRPPTGSSEQAPPSAPPLALSSGAHHAIHAVRQLQQAARVVVRVVHALRRPAAWRSSQHGTSRGEGGRSSMCSMHAHACSERQRRLWSH